MRGVIALLRYQTAGQDRKRRDELIELLKGAITDLIECNAIDSTELGAYFNLAIARDEEGNRPEAIRVSEEALSKRSSFPRSGQEKYLADVSVNLACYIAYDWLEEMDSAKKNALCTRILGVCRDCRDYLRDTVKSSKANSEFKASILRELAKGGDFKQLPQDTRAALEQLIAIEVKNE